MNYFWKDGVLVAIKYTYQDLFIEQLNLHGVMDTIAFDSSCSTVQTMYGKYASPEAKWVEALRSALPPEFLLALTLLGLSP